MCISKVADMDVPSASLVADLPCKLMRIEQYGGYAGVVRLFAGVDAKTAVVYLHGIQSHGGWFMRSMDFLRSRGAVVLAPDRRGSGLNLQQRGYCKNPEELLGDLDCCVDWLIKHSGIKRVHIVAVSWSGKLALVYAARHLEKLRSVVLVAPGLCPKVHIGLKEKIKVGINGVFDSHKLHEIPLQDAELFTVNPDMLDFINNDPLKLADATASFLITSTRLGMAVRKVVVAGVAVPVHLFLAGQDRIIDNDATIRLLSLLFNDADSQGAGVNRLKIYESASHTLEFEPQPEHYFIDLAAALGL